MMLADTFSVRHFCFAAVGLAERRIVRMLCEPCRFLFS